MPSESDCDGDKIVFLSPEKSPPKKQHRIVEPHLSYKGPIEEISYDMPEPRYVQGLECKEEV